MAIVGMETFITYFSYTFRLGFNAFRRVGRGVVDIFYPPRCNLCNASLNENEDSVCTHCTQNLPLIYSPHCPRCCRPILTRGGPEHICSDCAALARPAVSRIIAAGMFRDDLRELIHMYKYSYYRFLAPFLAQQILHQARRLNALNDIDLLVPVPLYWTRRRTRGFNQAREMGKVISKKTGVPLIRVRDFQRIRHTTPQVTLSAAGRKENIRGAFAVRNENSIKGKTIGLIDDVLTTGATTDECARTLRKAGADDVSVFVIARDI